MFNVGSLSTNLKCGLLNCKVTFANEEQEIGGIVSSLSACRTRESIPSKRAMQESPVPKQRPTVM